MPGYVTISLDKELRLIHFVDEDVPHYFTAEQADAFTTALNCKKGFNIRDTLHRHPLSERGFRTFFDDIMLSAIRDEKITPQLLKSHYETARQY